MESEWETNANSNKTSDGQGHNKKRNNGKRSGKSSKSTDGGKDNDSSLIIKNENNINNADLQDNINLYSNVPDEKQSYYDKQISPTRKRRKNTPKRARSSSEKNMAKGHKTTMSKECEKIDNSKNYLGSLLLNMNNNDAKINLGDDVNVYRSMPSAPEGETQSESPESRRKRIEIVSKQCRLHPSNEKYNQGPVLDPPPISPGIVVGYTPAGQRHEVDLNYGRPTWFNSEYARRQYDDATKINVSRMIHDLSKGQFLPDTLNPDVEKQYFKEKCLVTEEAKKYFRMKIKENTDRELQENNAQSLCCDNKESLSPLVKKTDKIQLLEIERQLIELTEFAIVKINDFPNELSKKICQLLNVQMKPLMFLKNPIIVETIEKLAKQRTYIHVSRSARALSDEIKLLFDVPPSQTFEQYFLSEVNNLKEKTKNMSKFDLTVMTEESEISNGVSYQCANIARSVERPEKQTPEYQEKDATKAEHTGSSEELEEEWVPVEEGDIWQDVLNDDDCISNSSNEGAQDMDYEEDDGASVEVVDGEMCDSHVSQGGNNGNSDSEDEMDEVGEVNTAKSEE